MVREKMDINQIEGLFRYNYRPLCMYALHYLGDVDSAEDVVQDSFTSMWLKLGEGTEIKNKRAYLYTAVRNKCLDKLRSTTRFESLDPQMEDSVEWEEEVREDSTTEAQLWTAIDALPAKRKEILLLNKRDGLKYSEIAEKLGLSVNTVRNQINRAMATLKEGVIKIYLWIFCW